MSRANMLSTGLTLYHSPYSPHSRRGRIFIAEKGLEVKHIEVDLARGEQHEEAYRRINPRRVVPALVLADGTSIAEVTAIWRYLEGRYPETPMLGASIREAAMVTMWERRAELDGLLPAVEAIRNVVTGAPGRALAGPHDYLRIPALAIRSRERVENFYADINARLAQQEYVAGDYYSAADITCLVTLDFAKRALGMTISEDFTALKRWHGAVSSRPGAVA
ncbi:glutathione S-transferase [Rhodanobacter sp. MP7CTX1]|uniref:glutathione S-transferase family protein n=1 Tax=Rhodanobacter sp. MP7CTX1 TaxID=2723084 RepID=UPI0017B54917|nr:glutathione S-transferase [Rhodanobacter sp. MP7CTX1]MBB6187523.1 glutathione S-transferase [Rhodanobacter sp. MP7CTX1]